MMKRFEMSGIVLAGGAASRIGRDKALLRVGGQTLIERTCAEMSKVFSEIIVISNSPDTLAWLEVAAVVPDIIKGIGPIGGIQTGLHEMANDHGFFAACDMPFLSAEVIRDEIEFFQARVCDAVVPRWDDRIEPLHAVYGKSCLPAIQSCIDARKRKIIAFYDDVRLQYWDLRSADKWRRYFHNVNTEADLRALDDVEGKK